MPDTTFSAVATSQSPTKIKAQTRHFVIEVDEPEGLGGKDEAANPVEYVLVSLMGCLNVVGQMVAKEMGIAIKSLTIKSEGDIDPAKFAGKTQEGRAGFKDIRVVLEPDMDADEQTKKKWLETVESRCPVSDNLLNPTPVSITIK